MNPEMQIQIARGLLSEVGYGWAAVDYNEEQGITVTGSVPLEVMGRVFILLAEVTGEDAACLPCFVKERASECIDGFCEA